MKITPRYLDGVVMAANALVNARAVVDSPRCMAERTMFFDAVSDWYGYTAGTGPYSRDRRVYAANWDHYLALGTEGILGDLFKLVASRCSGEPILVYRSSLSLLANNDVEGVIEQIAPHVESPLLCVSRRSLDDDWVDAWRDTEEAVWEYISKPDAPNKPVIVGFPLFRLEGDELGNVAEIQRLWGLAGFPAVEWPFSGGGLSQGGVALDSPLVAFPFGWRNHSADSHASDIISVDLPIGISGTCRFLRKVGSHFDRENEVEQLIQREVPLLMSKLRPFMANALMGRGALVVADPWTAAGLASALRELSMGLDLAVLLRREDAALEDGRDENLLEAPTLVDPHYEDVEELLRERAEKGLCDVVVGSGVLVDAAERASLPYVEITAPQCFQHFALPTPYMGFEGMLRMAERLTAAIGRAEHQRRVRRMQARPRAKPDPRD